MKITKYMGREFYTGSEDDPEGLYIDSTKPTVDDFRIMDFHVGCFEEFIKIMLSGLFEDCERIGLPFPYFYLRGYSLFEFDGDEYDGIDDDCNSCTKNDYWRIMGNIVFGGWHELDAVETAEFVRKVNTDYYDIRKEFPRGFKAYTFAYWGTLRVIVIPWIKD